MTSMMMATDDEVESNSNTVGELNSNRKRLVELIPHHALVDALPYADYFDATLKVS
jgi:hypothetical protein